MSKQQRGFLLTPKEIDNLPRYAVTTGSQEPVISDWRLRANDIAQAQLAKVINELFGPGKAIVPTNIPKSTKKTFIVDKEKLEIFWQEQQGE